MFLKSTCAKWLWCHASQITEMWATVAKMKAEGKWLASTKQVVNR
jgi:hypothetical protein